jgi:DNA-directed RNA polymerase specialized sigma24 family protein
VDIRTITEEERRKVYRSVMLMALAVTRSREEARELTQQAFLLLCTTRPWREEGPPFNVHMAGIVRSLAHHERLKRDRRLERDGRYVNESALFTDEKRQSAEVMSLAHARRKTEAQQARDDVADIRARLGDGAFELTILDLMAEGVKRPEHLVERTGRPDTAVKVALARIRRHTRAVLAARGRDTEEDS